MDLKVFDLGSFFNFKWKFIFFVNFGRGVLGSVLIGLVLFFVYF